MASSDNDKRKIQMIDIARMAGVSTSTVSRALNGSSLTNDETRQRIIELARSLNYTINQSAKSLRMGDNRTIGVVIPYVSKTRQHISDPFFLGMLGSLADALTDRNYDLLLSRVDADHLGDMASLYDAGRAKGLIVIGQWGHHDQLNELARRHVPIAVWGAQLPGQLYCSVGSDNVSGGVLATEHLLGLGRRRIVFIGDTEMPEAAKRYEGYLQAHKKLGLAVDPLLSIKSPFTAKEAQAAMLKFLDSGVVFDAVFAASDLIAINVMGVLTGRGISIPQQVSVVGYDDIDMASHSFPPLTTIRQPLDVAGGVLMDSLQDILEGRIADSQLLPTSLVVRGSTE
ncbi:LacI family DNA-binding transcriptional regulator [Limnohabitans sp.]|uniref:LacI family DNA-binding transcriptional regulator n=1 Tax=Limnohabitans sp. TaxID=1907725 RepID=UPI00286F6D76|nr:LacI family DNA-binding transcriptional regulator [Limnohabitans sp.]